MRHRTLQHLPESRRHRLQIGVVVCTLRRRLQPIQLQLSVKPAMCQPDEHRKAVPEVITKPNCDHQRLALRGTIRAQQSQLNGHDRRGRRRGRPLGRGPLHGPRPRPPHGRLCSSRVVGSSSVLLSAQACIAADQVIGHLHESLALMGRNERMDSPRHEVFYPEDTLCAYLAHHWFNRWLVSSRVDPRSQCCSSSFSLALSHATAAL